MTDELGERMIAVSELEDLIAVWRDAEDADYACHTAHEYADELEELVNE